jgi:hypothetical protein
MNLRHHINGIYRQLIKMLLEYGYTPHLYIRAETGFANITVFDGWNLQVITLCAARTCY